MLRNTKSRGAESSALQNEKAFVLAGQENDTIHASVLQGFSSCVPCANCPHFRLVRFNSRKIRHQCGYSGLWLESCGVIECPVRREGVDCA